VSLIPTYSNVVGGEIFNNHITPPFSLVYDAHKQADLEDGFVLFTYLPLYFTFLYFYASDC
ncbi:MAG TPA: hypothetical protein PK821_04905, partial [Victivallales bacterium]|nr:hypothetical protein [Victivallales bacterium]